MGDGDPWEAADRDTVRSYERGGLILQKEGAWFDAPNADGVSQLHLYPTPSSGLTIELEWAFRPPPMAADADEPSEFPEEFHPGLCWEAAATYYETMEDNPELAQRNQEKADSYINGLIAYGNERRSGNGVFIPAIVGWTAPVR